VAGTYATRFAAIAATGVGEQIVDDAVAARLETRVRDGMSLREASLKAFHEAQDKKRLYGWISADANGSFACAHTTPAMGFVVLDYNGEVIKSS
jgi:L-asparaginase